MRSLLFGYLTVCCIAILGNLIGTASAQTSHAPIYTPQTHTYYTPRQCRVCPSQSDYTHYGAYQHQHRHREIVRLIDVAQINPAYTSSYSPDGYDAATQQAIKAQIGLLSQQIDALTQKLSRAPTAAPAPAPGAKAPAPNPTPERSTAPQAVQPGVNPSAIGLAVLNAKCAVCHQDGKLPQDQKFTLLDVKGALVPLTDKQKLRVTMKCYSGQMPPPNNTKGIPAVTDAEFAAIMALLQPGS